MTSRWVFDLRMSQGCRNGTHIIKTMSLELSEVDRAQCHSMVRENFLREYKAVPRFIVARLQSSHYVEVAAKKTALLRASANTGT